MKKAFIIYGPPGSGKGTQAELLARKFNVTHIDTGRYIEGIVHASEAKKDSVLLRERILFDTGKLCTPSWILKIISDIVCRLAKVGQGVVFSGSPRTLFEAFGDKQNSGLIKTLEVEYGRKNVLIIKLEVPSSASIKRNSSRLVCSLCGLPALGKSKVRRCAFCDAKMKKRTLDKPSVIKIRLDEYKNRTYPIFAELKKQKWSISEIDGTEAPYNVHNAIVKRLKLK